MKSETRSVIPGDVLEVWHEERLIGRVERLSASVLEIGFVYNEAWARSRDAFPISVRMPLSDLRYGPEVVYPWFMNLLPEGNALQQVGHLLRVGEADVFGMLHEMGRDLPGALDIRPSAYSGTGAEPGRRKFTDAELADVLRSLPDHPLLAGEDGVHMSVAGAQHKLPVIRFRDGSIGIGLNGTPSTYILKPESKHFHSSVENEAFCLRLAAAAGLPAARATMHRTEDVSYLLVERYDRRRNTERRIRRIHQEDLCQATGFAPYLKYEWNGEVAKHGPTLKACMDALGATSAPAPNKIRFLDYMVFNVLCGNVDAHSKNYSILIEDGAAISMTPIYDVMNGDIYENVTRNLAMKIAGKQRGGYIYGRHWDRFAEENGLSATAVRQRVRRLSETVLRVLPEVIAEMDQSTHPSYVYKEIGNSVAYYCRNMVANLDTDHENDEEASVSRSPQDDAKSSSSLPR